MTEITDEKISGQLATPRDESSLTSLIDHLLQKHHAYTKTALEELHPLLEKVVRVHGGSHPELTELRDLYVRLRDDMHLHLMKEENILFPYIRALDAEGPVPAPHFGTVANPIRMMIREHETDDAILRRMMEVTNEFSLPPGACASYTSLYAGLRELVDDLVQHMYLENQFLFPKAIAKEATALGKAT
ncbi:MAG TPA: hemerythrin domain-containing protein [Gallionella sp.]|nr:hemerythrin domain-containing protein [Gallionella sp.]